MKFLLAACVVSATVGVGMAAYSAPCTAYLNTLTTDSALSQCRTLKASGLQEFAVTKGNSTDPAILQPLLDSYCAKPRCTEATYLQVINGLATNCAADLKSGPIDENLGTTLFMWYASGPQHDGMCLKKDNSTEYCIVEGLNMMNRLSILPFNLASQKSFWGFVQFLLPLRTPATPMTKTDFCTECSQKIADYYVSWYKSHPAPFAISANLTSDREATDIAYQYESLCSTKFSASNNGILVTNNGTNSNAGKGTGTILNGANVHAMNGMITLATLLATVSLLL
ncbi:hypothetical protein K7432_007484 [Basidiobolus ranarum]|uniref:Uncharacterized protein n=1 Tax=Basidiobolus ranarum TaxID=34480 RepID=A0ABR2WTJ3_9FUNG